MFPNIVYTLKNSKIFNSIIYILIFTFILMINGCKTTYEQRIPPETVKYNIGYKIISAIMKSGLVVNLEDKGARYMTEYKDKKNVIVYGTIDTIHVPPNAIKKSYRTSTLDINDILYVNVEKEEINAGLTILAVVGIIAALVVIVYLVAFMFKESCPFIYSFDGDKYIFDAEPYGGAVAEGLKKTDYSRLKYLKDVDGKYMLLMRNEADETQHTDELKMLVVDHPPNTDVAPDISGNITVFSKENPSVMVTDENGYNVTTFFENNDKIQWQSNLPSDTSFIGKNLRNELTFKFPKPKNAKRVKLLVNAGTALWGGFMIKSMLNLRGNNVDLWYQNINNKGNELSKLYSFMEREELYTLKVKVRENNDWITKGFITAGGPFLDEDRIIDLDIKDISGDTLTIKLNPPIGYWKIDYVGVIYDELPKPQIKEIPISYAQDEKGRDILELLNKKDNNYYDMPDTTSYANIYYDVPPQKEGTKRSIFLKTTGYYDIHLKKDTPEQTELIERIYQSPGLILEYSLRQYVERIKSLGMTEQ